MEKCGVIRLKHSEKQCFRLVWRIEYVQYQHETETTTIHSDEYFQKETSIEDELQIELRKYLVYILQRKEYI